MGRVDGCRRYGVPRGSQVHQRRSASARDRRVAREGEDDRRLSRQRLRRRVEHRPYPRPSEPRFGRSEGEAREVRDARRRDRVRLRAVLPRRRGQEAAGRRSQAEAEGRGRALPRDGRGSRGGGDRLAPARGAAAEDPGPSDGLPRDHEGRDHEGARRDARGRPAARRRAGDAPHPRPALRLRGLARALEEGDAEALRRPRPVGRRPPRRRARARAARLRLGRLLGHQGALRPGQASKRGWSPSTASASLRVATSPRTGR